MIFKVQIVYTKYIQIGGITTNWVIRGGGGYFYKNTFAETFLEF